MAKENTQQISTEAMQQLLDARPRMSPATRHVLLTGQSTFVDSRGQRYRAPQTASTNGPTHRVDLMIDPVRTHGVKPCKLD